MPLERLLLEPELELREEPLLKLCPPLELEPWELELRELELCELELWDE